MDLTSDLLKVENDLERIINDQNLETSDRVFNIKKMLAEMV